MGGSFYTTVFLPSFFYPYQKAYFLNQEQLFGDTLVSFLKYNPLKSIYSIFTVINMAVVTFIASNAL